MKTLQPVLASASLLILLGSCATSKGPNDSDANKRQSQSAMALVVGAREVVKPSKPVDNRPSLESIKRKMPEKITPLTAQQLETKVPHSYYFDYPFEPQPGKRIWKRIDSKTWHEVYPDGLTSVFKVLGHAKVSDSEGTMVVKWTGDEAKTATTNDGGLQAFIPDLGSATMHHWYRNTDRGDTAWNDLAPMNDVK